MGLLDKPPWFFATTKFSSCENENCTSTPSPEVGALCTSAKADVGINDRIIKRLKSNASNFLDPRLLSAIVSSFLLQ